MRPLRWLFSSTVRQATAMRHHVGKTVAAQSDVLSPTALAAMRAALTKLEEAIRLGEAKPSLVEAMGNLENEAAKWLKPYPNAYWRENVEVFLVALAVAMAIRTFFLQPFKIPTGSMQPTLYGITHQNLLGESGVTFPNRLARFWDYWIHGTSYFHVVAPEDGNLRAVKPPIKLLLFNLKQDYLFNGTWHSVWFPVDDLFYRAGLTSRDGSQMAGQFFQRNQDMIKLKVTAGDHLFVNRLAYNFVHPKRGDIVVFHTRGMEKLGDQNTYYIKRLVGLGGETLKLQPEYDLKLNVRTGESITVPVGRLMIDGAQLSASTPNFENIYSFSSPPMGTKVLEYSENNYYGHALLEGLSVGQSHFVPPGSYYVLGDNTMNSSDSRYWGDFTREHVIGKSSLVYWPISRRFGWGVR
jgi:signal peptidase I